MKRITKDEWKHIPSGWNVPVGDELSETVTAPFRDMFLTLYERVADDGSHIRWEWEIEPEPDDDELFGHGTGGDSGNDYDGYDDEPLYDDEPYCPSATAGDYGPGNPWDAPGMSIRDFI